MKPEDKVTADRLNAAGTTQTPLTDGLSERIRYVVAKLDKLNPDYAAYEFVVPACYFRKQELALAASRAREAELWRALKLYVGYHGPCLPCHRDDADMGDAEVCAAAEIDDMVAAALTAPPTNSKEMNK